MRGVLLWNCGRGIATKEEAEGHNNEFLTGGMGYSKRSLWA